MPGRPQAAPDAREDTSWWQGAMMQIKARGEETGGALGMVDGRFYHGFGLPLHVHNKEDEAMYVIGGEIRFRRGDEGFAAGPGTWVGQLRGIPHTFRVESDSARALVIVTPGGFERMFEEGGVPTSDWAEPPPAEYDPEAAAALAKRFRFEVVGPQLG